MCRFAYATFGSNSRMAVKLSADKNKTSRSARCTSLSDQVLIIECQEGCERATRGVTGNEESPWIAPVLSNVASKPRNRDVFHVGWVLGAWAQSILDRRHGDPFPGKRVANKLFDIARLAAPRQPAPVQPDQDGKTLLRPRQIEVKLASLEFVVGSNCFVGEVGEIGYDLHLVVNQFSLAIECES